jgi:hypothetical protein
MLPIAVLYLGLMRCNASDGLHIASFFAADVDGHNKTNCWNVPFDESAIYEFEPALVQVWYGCDDSNTTRVWADAWTQYGTCVAPYIHGAADVLGYFFQAVVYYETLDRRRLDRACQTENVTSCVVAVADVI